MKQALYKHLVAQRVLLLLVILKRLDELLSETDANGATTSFSYDSLGRLLKKSYPDNATETFSYDAKGNILTATNANTSYTFTYSTSGKVASVADSSGRRGNLWGQTLIY